MSNGKYLMAKTQAQAALQGTDNIKAQIQAAIDAQAQARMPKP